MHPEAAIGHAPTGGITSRLHTMVGLLRAKELLLSGRWVEPEEGLRIGLYTELHDDPSARAAEVAAAYADAPRRSQSAVKRAIELAAAPTLETNLRFEVETATYCFQSAETAESFVRFQTQGRP